MSCGNFRLATYGDGIGGVTDDGMNVISVQCCASGVDPSC